MERVPFDADRLLALPLREHRRVFEIRDTILYALGVGAGPGELEFVYEKALETLPTQAVVLGDPGLWVRDPQYGIDWKRLLHVEQQLEVRRDLPVEGEVVSTLTIDDIIDKGADKGALMYTSCRLCDAASGDLFAIVSHVTYLRGDGGKGGRRADPPPARTPPAREPDEVIMASTHPELALMYRLSGDYNPLHVDPAAAAAAGFDRPILHGLCTYGVVGRVLLKALRARGGRRLTGLDARFSSPVFPGETLRTDVWWEDGRADFRTTVVERDKEVLSNGQARFS